MDDPKSTPIRGKKSGDGLSKHQRYYRNHLEVRAKNRERERRRREDRRAAMEAAATAASPDEDSSVKPPEKHKQAAKEVMTPIAVSADTAVRTGVVPHAVEPPIPNPIMGSQPTVVAIKKRKHALSVLPEDFLHLQGVDIHTSLDATGSVIHGRCETIPQRPYVYSEIVNLERLIKDVMLWGSGWGGVTYWWRGLELSFQKAVDRHRVNHWRKQMADHVSLGRSLLRKIHVDDVEWPKEDWRVREMFNTKLELAIMLVKGLTILECKTPLPPEGGAVRYRYGREETKEEQSAVETDVADIELRGNDGDVESDSDESTGSESEGSKFLYGILPWRKERGDSVEVALDIPQRRENRW